MSRCWHELISCADSIKNINFNLKLQMCVGSLSKILCCVFDNVTQRIHIWGNLNGPRIEPWRTPQAHLDHSLLFKHEERQFRFPPAVCILHTIVSLLCPIVSNTGLMSSCTDTDQSLSPALKFDLDFCVFFDPLHSVISNTKAALISLVSDRETGRDL